VRPQWFYDRKKKMGNGEAPEGVDEGGAEKYLGDSSRRTSCGKAGLKVTAGELRVPKGD